MMEKVTAKLVDGQVEYKRIGDRVERLRVVKDEIILEGSSNCLKRQIQTAEARVADMEKEIANPCNCERCMLAKADVQEVVAEDRKNMLDLQILWKAATGKDYPEK